MGREKSVSPAIFLLLVLCFAPSVSANQNIQKSQSIAGVSHARVVSLSLVEGTVLMRRTGSAEWNRAALNAPIEEGWSILTARQSLAEVQFENGSTVRIGERSRVDFTTLALAPHRVRVNHLALAFGFATIHVIPRRHDEFVVDVSSAALTPRGGTEFRTDLERGNMRVEVFHGYVRVADSNVAEKLGKNKSLACDYNASRGAAPVTSSVHMDQWDKWVKARDEQAKLAAFAGATDPMDGWAQELTPLGGLGPAFSADDSF